MACATCAPELDPTGSRREGHFAVRFGVQDCLLRVFKDGQQIMDVYEVDCLAGLAWRYEVPYRLCPCQQPGVMRPAAYIDTGNFAVTNEGSIR